MKVTENKKNIVVTTPVRYLLWTIVYVFLLFINLSGMMPLGILLGVLPASLLYMIALLLVRKRSKRTPYHE